MTDVAQALNGLSSTMTQLARDGELPQYCLQCHHVVSWGRVTGYCWATCPLCGVHRREVAPLQRLVKQER